MSETFGFAELIEAALWAPLVRRADALVTRDACATTVPGSTRTVPKPGAETGVAVTQGGFAAVDGRLGEVTTDPDSDNEIRVKWLDDESTSKWTKVDELTSVVASRDDLIEKGK